MSPRPSSRDAILDAAEGVVAEFGAARLTLDAVAERAGVSKGGLIYNFPSKELLLEAMVSRAIETFEEQRKSALAALPEAPGRELRAFVLATLEGRGRDPRISMAILAASANAPQLLEPVRARVRERLAETTAGAASFERAAIAAFATDGLWLLETLQISPLTPEQRRSVVSELFRMADEAEEPPASPANPTGF